MIAIIAIFSFAVDAEEQQVRHFDIWEYQIIGNSLIDSAEIESALYPYLGPGKDLQSIEDARSYLQALYKNKDYPLVVVSIPEQNVIAGVVRLEITEGKIDRLRISGNEYFSRRNIRKEIPSLSVGNPLQMAQVRSEIDQVNRLNPYRSITPVLRPGRYRGTMEVELKVKDELPLHAMLEANNRYSSNTSHSRLMASVGYDNLWQKHHSVSFSYQTAPEQQQEVDVVGMTYILPVTHASRLAIYAIDSNSEVAAAEELDVIGAGRVMGVRHISMLSSAQDYIHNITLGMDYKDFDETQQLLGADDFNVPISYTGFTIGYTGTIKNQQDYTQFSLASNFGLRALNDQQEFEYKRYLARANYFYLKADIKQGWSLSDKLDLEFKLRGQYTVSALISNEQIGAGGVDTVRGYLESAAMGDNGVIGNLELTYNALSAWQPASIQLLNIGLYVDASRLSVVDALADQTSRYKLLGAGIGVNVRALREIDLAMYYAAPLYTLDQQGFDDVARLHFSLSYKF